MTLILKVFLIFCSNYGRYEKFSSMFNSLFFQILNLSKFIVNRHRMLLQDPEFYIKTYKEISVQNFTKQAFALELSDLALSCCVTHKS